MKLLDLWKKYSFILLIAFLLISLLDFRFALAAVVCMMGPVIVSFFKGRFWCGNLCPRGSFYDNIVSKFSKHKKVPCFLKSKFFRAFMIFFIMLMFTLGLIKNWGDFYGIGMMFYRIILITTMIGVALSMIYNERTWCHFCPMGTIASIIARFRKSRKLLEVSGKCVSCRKCEKKCSLGIVPYEYKGDLISHPDCIQCNKCASSCPIKAIGYK